VLVWFDGEKGNITFLDTFWRDFAFFQTLANTSYHSSVRHTCTRPRMLIASLLVSSLASLITTINEKNALATQVVIFIFQCRK